MAQGLILVADSSAWIAAYRPEPSLVKEHMVDAIQNHLVLVPDLVLVEVLRGIKTERKANEVALEFNKFKKIEVAGHSMALRAAAVYRFLRAKGITVRGTVDLLIATWCIENNVPLLHSDRDFEGFEEHLGLRRWVQ